MTAAGVSSARSRRRTTRAEVHPRPAVVARATLPAEAIAARTVSASRRDLHAARRLRRRDAAIGLGILAAALGATVCVLDMVH